jgi:putative ABC transport system ATP-binding protein
VWTPDYGTVEIDGVDVTNMPAYKRASLLCRVFQDPLKGTAPDMEIAENLAIAERRGTRRKLKWGCTRKNRESYRKLLEQLDLGLEDRLSTKVGLLSGGQRQAVTLLMATIRQPKLLLLDEHTAALDPKTAAKVLELTDKLVTENNLTTLMVTHNMHDAIAYGNRLIMMDEGRIVVDISGEEKKKLTIDALLDLFEVGSGNRFADDKELLSKR